MKQDYKTEEERSAYCMGVFASINGLDKTDGPYYKSSIYKVGLHPLYAPWLTGFNETGCIGAYASEEVKCHIIAAPCEHFIYQLDRNEEIAISHCTHPDNKSDYEGNCTHTLCPLNPASEDYS